MSLPPPPQDPQGAQGGGFGPPQGFGPPGPPGQPPAGGFGPPGGGHGGPGGYGQGGFGAGGYGPPGGPGQPPYGMVPPPGGGNRGAKVAAIVVGSVLAAAVAVGGVVLWIGGDGGGGKSAEAAPGASSETTPEPDTESDAVAPTEAPGAEETAPDASGGTDPGSPTSSPGEMVPYVVLDPGQCFDHPALSSDVTVVEKRPCDEPHNGEVIANETLSGSFADEKELRKKVLALCGADATERLESLPNDGTMYYYYAIYPSLPTYRVRGDDTISCALTLSNAMDGPKLDAPLPD